MGIAKSPRVLFLAQYFPPLGGPGVQRASKFVKYLRDFSWEPIVLTGNGKGSQKWAPADASLMGDIPADIRVFRAESSSPIGRASELLSLGTRTVTELNPAVIFVTMSPFSDARIAATLSSRTGIPWVADLRDPWALDEFQIHKTRWHRMVERTSMRRALSSAASIIMNTPEALRALRSAFPELTGRARISITNGFDAEDFSGAPPGKDESSFTIVHSGFFHAEQGLQQRSRSLEFKLLGRSFPGVELLSRSHYYLIQALTKWRTEAPEEFQRVRVVCAGAASRTDQELVDKAGLSKTFEFTGFVSHKRAVELVRTADLLFLPMQTLPPAMRATIVPGKTYEYLASGRPILGAVPSGDAQTFITNAGTGTVCKPNDANAIAECLRQSFSAWTKSLRPKWKSDYVDQFERRVLTGQLATELSAVANLDRSLRRVPESAAPAAA